MPRKTRTGRTYRRRRVPRRTRRTLRRPYFRRRKSRIPNFGYLLPSRIRVKLPYYDNTNRSLSAVSVGSANWIYRGNGLVDPLLSGPVGSGGHQPMMYDNLATLYGRALVKGSKITVMVHSNSSTTPGGAYTLFLYPNTSLTHIWSTLSNWTAMREQDKMRWKYIPNIYENAGPKTTMKAYTATRTMFQYPIKNTDYSVNTVLASDPTYQWYWNVALSTLDETSAITCIVDVKLVYYCEFYDPVPLGLS